VAQDRDQSVVGSCDHGNIPSDFIEGGKFFDVLSDN
jgi:hypothetical protein